MSAEAASLNLPQPKGRLQILPFRRSRAEGQAEEPVVTAPQRLNELLAPDRWIPNRKADPELRKVLGVIQTHLSESRRLLAVPKAGITLRNAAAVRELTALVRQDPAALAIDTGWELAATLKRLNLRLGDEAYIASRLEYEHRRDAKKGKWHGWNTHFDPRELRDLVNAYRSGRPTKASHRQAVDRLTFLYLRREEAGRDRRCRAALKSQLLTQLLTPFLVLLVGLGVAIHFATTGDFLATMSMAACAGALGSMLSGVFKVRDQLVQLDELRGFIPAMRVQPMIGASAGLILFLVLDSKVLEVGAGSSAKWSGIGLLAFVAGFSEPFFLGIVQRVAHVPDPPTEKAKAKK
jgi:hypothetical protein